MSILLGASSHRFQQLPVGSRIEVSPASFKISRRIGEILRSEQGGVEHVSGCALLIDYGDDHAFGNSFRVRCFCAMPAHFLFVLTAGDTV